MLTEQQVDLIVRVSRWASFGVLMGAVCGLLVATALLIKRSRRAHSFARLVDALYGILPGAAGGATVAALLAFIVELVEATYCERGKAAYIISIGLESLVLVVCAFLTLLVAGIAAIWAIPSGQAQRQSWSQTCISAVAWSLIGAAIGAIAGVGLGFDGYFILQSNAGPIHSAAVGAIFLAIASFLCRMMIGQLSILLDRR
jgi:hypothetical protein